MEDSTVPFSPEDLQVSKLRFYSLGVVAANKALGSAYIEVTPTEEVPMLDGELDDQKTTVTEEGQGVSGQNYSVSVSQAASIKAEWLRLNYGNRRTAPDVRRGARVIIYQFGDSNKFYWTTLLDDYKLRKLETVIYAWTATAVEDDENGPGNSYFLEISTHKGCTTFHTSKKNGEFCQYDVQIDSKNGKVVIQDDVGNFFMLDSKAHQLRMENVDGSVFDITKQIATITTVSEINMKTSKYTLTADTGEFHITDMSVDGNTVACSSSDVSFNNGSFTVNSGATSIQ